jgi:membrane-bound serine protease (ClpP class)
MWGADEIGMAPGTRIGGVTIVFGCADCEPDSNVLTFPPGLDLSRSYSSTEAADLGITTREAPTIGEFILNLPGVESREVPQEDGQMGREPVTVVRFGQLSLVDQLMHSVASPAVTYLLLAIGLALIVFELFTAGVGVAGVIGAGSLVLSCYGLAVLPTNWWGIALVVISFMAFAIDVQTGIPRFWTGVGIVTFIAGSLTLYDGLSLSWITLAVGVIGVVLAFVAGMPNMVRARFSTPTIGREWMIGEIGRAATAIAPDGVVQMREALWRAYTNRATPIEELDRGRVVGIEGLVLEVEPEDGGARDYRERRTSAED